MIGIGDRGRTGLGALVAPYVARGPLAALFLGISSGFPYAMIGATLTTRLKQDGIDKSSITVFTLVFLAYNLKFLWAWLVEGVRLPLIGRLGQRVSWMLFAGTMVIASVIHLGLVAPADGIMQVAIAAILVGVAGATLDIVVDAYRIEQLEPEELGIGAGMSQYGWRIGSSAAGGLALVVAARHGWSAAYLLCAAFALPAMLTALVLGEPHRHHQLSEKQPAGRLGAALIGPLIQFFQRPGAWIVLAFILLHKIGDTLANLTFRLLFDDLKFTNDEIALYDVGLGFWALMAGIFVGEIAYTRLGMKRAVMLSLVLMAVSNLSFAGLAALGHSNVALGSAIGFENFASGIGGVCVVAYFSALCDLRFTAAQYALISAAASIVGRVATGLLSGDAIKAIGYVDFYLATTLAALPGILLFGWMARNGMIDRSIGDAATEA